MKFISQVSKSTKKWLLAVCLLISFATAPTVSAFNLSNISGGLTNLSQSIQSIGAAVQIGTGLVDDIRNIFGGGSRTSATAAGGGVPNVPNGGILAGPGNSAYGISYARDVFLPNLTNWVVSAILAGSVIVIIVAGIMYIVGGGDQEQTNKARETIVWGVIGVAVTIAAYALVRIVITINFLG